MDYTQCISYTLQQFTSGLSLFVISRYDWVLDVDTLIYWGPVGGDAMALVMAMR